MALDPQLSLWILIGSLFPDIDKANSMLGSRIPFVAKMFTHRKQTHSLPVTILLFGLASYFFFNHMNYVLVFFFGALTHIFLDMFNLSGVYLLWPFSKRRFTFRGKIRSRLYGWLMRIKWVRIHNKFWRKISWPIRKQFEKLIDFGFLTLFTVASIYFLYHSYGSFSGLKLS
jgi:membrane-bound metal-dependent hydrolase YbcI (DUF457 family)